MKASSVVIDQRFRGPAGSGNGGYTCGLLAGYLDAPFDPVRVALRRPPPLDVALHIESSLSEGYDGPAARLMRDDEVIGEAVTGEFVNDPVGPVSASQAAAAESSYQGLSHHPFPGCFVCGTARERDGDGLRLAPGPVVPGRSACVWTPDPSLAVTGSNRTVALEFVWAALDCPGAWTSDLEERPLVLGTMTAWCAEMPVIGTQYVVVGAHRGAEGRKTFTATALYDEGQRCLARAEHVWVAVDPRQFTAPTNPL